MNARSAFEYIINHISQTGTCWVWMGGCDTRGYGQMKIRNSRKAERVHRRVWEMEHLKKIPKGMLVLHRCDNSLCVRPDHLYIGTHADNSRDAVKRGRSSRGEHRPGAKLTEKLVKAMRRRATWGWSYPRIGEWAGVNTSTARNVCVNKSWKHVE